MKGIGSLMIVAGFFVATGCDKPRDDSKLPPKPLEVGEIVWLKSAGNQRMVVTKLKPNGEVECTWANQYGQHTGTFLATLLERTCGFMDIEAAKKPRPPIAPHEVNSQ